MRACFKLWSVVAVGLAFLPALLRAELVYVANAGSNNVSAYSIGPNGALAPVAGSPFPAGRDPRSLAVDLFRRFVCVANALSNNVSVYRIGANGGLTLVAGSPFPAGNDPRSLAFSP
jgi:6-phosphogluconolactonase